MKALVLALEQRRFKVDPVQTAEANFRYSPITMAVWTMGFSGISEWIYVNFRWQYIIINLEKPRVKIMINHLMSIVVEKIERWDLGYATFGPRILGMGQGTLKIRNMMAIFGSLKHPLLRSCNFDSYSCHLMPIYLHPHASAWIEWWKIWEFCDTLQERLDAPSF